MLSKAALSGGSRGYIDLLDSAKSATSLKEVGANKNMSGEELEW